MRKAGSHYWAHVTITAIKDESSNLNGFLKIVRDLTAQKQAEEQRSGLLTNKQHEHMPRRRAKKQRRQTEKRIGFCMFSVTSFERRLCQSCFPPQC
jgi:hypothetical protein